MLQTIKYELGKFNIGSFKRAMVRIWFYPMTYQELMMIVP